MPINVFLKYYIFNICLAILTTFCSQEALCAELSIFQRWARGSVSIEQYHDFRLKSRTLVPTCEAIFAINDAVEILSKEVKKTPDYPKMLESVESCQKSIFDRLALYYGMEELDYKTYQEEITTYFDLLKGTANNYLKMGKYYEMMGNYQKAKATYRHVIVSYTDDIFKSYVKKAEFALVDLEAKQEQSPKKRKKTKKLTTSDR